MSFQIKCQSMPLLVPSHLPALGGMEHYVSHWEFSQAIIETKFGLIDYTFIIHGCFTSLFSLNNFSAFSLLLLLPLDS